MKIESFVNNEYRDYAVYVLESRAIPNVIDGLKPSQRKIVYTAINQAKSKFIKTASLSGAVINIANYHHGDTSLNAAINGLAAEWSNNLPLIQGEGNFGSRLVNEAGAARYTFSKLNKNFDTFFADNDVLEASHDPEDPEPRFYLPLIPWVLVNGVKGIAVGFATEIQPREPSHLAAECINYLQKGKGAVSSIPPSFPDWTGSCVWDNINHKWIAQGVYFLQGRKMTITELPPGIEREAYVKHLDKLEDHPNSPISYYKDDSRDNFKFEIRLKNSANLDPDYLMRAFKLKRTLSENLTVIDETGSLKIFDNEIGILRHFVDYRLGVYKRRYAHYIDRDLKEVARLDALRKFILAVVNGQLTLKGKTKKQLEVAALKFVDKQYVGSCLALQTYRFCKDEIATLVKRIKGLETDIIRWRKINIKAQYVKELKGLKF